MNEVIEYLVTEGRRKILAVYRPDSCIASTQIALRVLQAHGATAWPQAVKLDILNAAAREAMENDWPMEMAQKAGAKIIGVDGTGALSAGRGWDGHLVAMTRDSGGTEVVVDLSLDQFARPESGIHVRPTAFPVLDGWPVAWREGDPPYSVLYQKIPSRSYRSTPDWRNNRPVWEAIATEILAEIPPNPR